MVFTLIVLLVTLLVTAITNRYDLTISKVMHRGAYMVHTTHKAATSTLCKLCWLVGTYYTKCISINANYNNKPTPLLSPLQNRPITEIQTHQFYTPSPYNTHWSLIYRLASSTPLPLQYPLVMEIYTHQFYTPPPYNTHWSQRYRLTSSTLLPLIIIPTGLWRHRLTSSTPLPFTIHTGYRDTDSPVLHPSPYNNIVCPNITQS